ncbi:MAG TPA: tetratricopeptide repeat protein [Longimicrobium sp.]|jgi:tetratricopeptide (TPR) repeat protein|nr:tetratricopeptide repeat protein [Longimicrobium sp.]
MSGDVFQLFNEGVSASQRADQLREEGDHEGADRAEAQSLEAFDRVLGREPRHLGALSYKGMCCARRGRTAEAVSLFQTAVEVEPGFAENHRQLGLCHAELGDFAAARAATSQALQLDGTAGYRHDAAVELYNFGGHVMRMAAAHRDAARHHEERQSYRHAQGFFVLVLDIEPDNPHASKALAIVARCLGGPG